MKKPLNFYFFLVVLLLMLTFPGFTQKAHEGESLGLGKMECKQLNLTHEQQHKMQQLCLDLQKEMLTLRAAFQAKKLDLQKLILEKSDTNSINIAIDAVSKACAEIQKKAFANHEEIIKLLTEEQKKMLDQIGCRMGCGMGMQNMGCGMRMYSMGCGMGKHNMTCCAEMKAKVCGVCCKGKGCCHSFGKGERKLCLTENLNCKIN